MPIHPIAHFTGYCHTVPQSGKPQFSYIYGVALIGSASMYALLNLMSASGINAYRTASVLGYCMIPLVFLSMFSVVASLE